MATWKLLEAYSQTWCHNWHDLLPRQQAYQTETCSCWPYLSCTHGMERRSDQVGIKWVKLTADEVEKMCEELSVLTSITLCNSATATPVLSMWVSQSYGTPCDTNPHIGWVPTWQPLRMLIRMGECPGAPPQGKYIKWIGENHIKDKQ